MKPFVILIGGDKSGKSTIIASLTGCRNHGFKGLVTDQSTGRQIYVIASSPQESNLTSAQLAADLQNAYQQASVIAVVVASQTTHTHTSLSLEDIISTAQANGVWSFHYYILNPPHGGSAINVAAITSRLSAVGVTATCLDARRFAHLNAADIKTGTGIPY